MGTVLAPRESHDFFVPLHGRNLCGGPSLAAIQLATGK